MTTAPEPPAPTEPLLTVRHLTATYSTNEGPVPAVRDISFDLYPREVLALVGESAAGKSTVATPSSICSRNRRPSMATSATSISTSRIPIPKRCARSPAATSR